MNRIDVLLPLLINTVIIRLSNPLKAARIEYHWNNYVIFRMMSDGWEITLVPGQLKRFYLHMDGDSTTGKYLYNSNPLYSHIKEVQMPKGYYHTKRSNVKHSIWPIHQWLSKCTWTIQGSSNLKTNFNLSIRTEWLALNPALPGFEISCSFILNITPLCLCRPVSLGAAADSLQQLPIWLRCKRLLFYIVKTPLSNTRLDYCPA